MAITEMNFFSGGEGSPCEAGYITDWSSGDYKKTLGFNPKQLALFSLGTNYHSMYFYDENKANDKFYGAQGTSQNWTTGFAIGGNLYYNGIKSIDDDGFTLEKYSATYGSDNIFYIAIG